MTWDRASNHSWRPYDSGRSIGTEGSAGGVVVRDVEHAWGARATLERDTSPGPWAITWGVYSFGLRTSAFALHWDAVGTWDRVLDELVGVLDAMPDAETPEEELDWSEASRLFGAIAKR